MGDVATKTISRNALNLIIGVLIGIVGWVFSMAWFTKLILMIIAACLIVYVVARLKWTIKLRLLFKVILSIIVLIIVGCIGWYPIKDQWEKDHFFEQIKKDIYLSINYHLACLTKSPPRQPTYPRRLSRKNREVLRAPFEQRNDYCLAVRICNDNEVPLRDSHVFLSLPLKVIVQRPKLWQYDNIKKKHDLVWRTDLSILQGLCNGPNEIVRLGFPRPGSYPVNYTISGIVREKTITVNGMFYLELTEE